MSSERQEKWREISRCLDEALDLDEEARRAWLGGLDDRAPSIAGEVRSLLAEQASLTGSPLLSENATAGFPRTDLAGQRLGSYTLESMLGHGGMGTVWLASRSDGRFEGRAAVKLLSASLLGRPAEQRFIQEGSVLGRLKHPNIAHLLDAGVAPGGQPYLVLEYIEGERIDAYAERHALDLEARVRLFLDVLAAVAHAHSHLIVHRDLKPSNIFVTEGGVVKLLDFGIAALLGADDPQLTRDGGAGMTPAYAAPEQLLGNTVTTATDVYALGLLLFVLLCGRHPLEPDGKSAPELARATLEHEAPRLSRLAGDARRERALRGDLENIVAKALKKVPADRYSTAEMMAQDLRRYLAHEPVSARPDSLGYRASKFVRRHRGAVASGVITALALVTAFAVTTLQMVEARRQRDAAVFQSKRAEYQTRFAHQIMSEVGSDGRPITIRELMQKGIEVLEKNYGDDPRFVISALINISGRYMDLGETDDEYATLVKAERLARKLGDPAQIASVQCNTVETELQAGRPEKAAERMQDGIANLAKAENPSLGGRIECDIALVRLKWDQGDIPGAMAIARPVAELMEKNGLDTDAKYNTVVSMLEIMLSNSGKTREALAWNERAIATLERAGRGGTMSMAGVRHNRASYFHGFGELRSSYEQERAVVEQIATQQGVDSVPAAFAQRAGFLQVRLEETDAGLVWLDRAVAQADAQQNLVLQMSTRVNRARAQLILARHDRVVTDIDQAERLVGSAGAYESFGRQVILHTRAELLLARGDTLAALDAVNRLLGDLGYPQDRAPPRLPAVLTLRARVESTLGRQAEALATARQALSVSEEHALSADRSADVGAALMAMARAQRALGDAAGARASAKRAAKALANGLGPDHSETREAATF